MHSRFKVKEVGALVEQQPKPAKVTDILDALKRSLESKAAPAKPAATKRAAKRTGKAAKQFHVGLRRFRPRMIYPRGLASSRTTSCGLLSSRQATKRE